MNYMIPTRRTAVVLVAAVVAALLMGAGSKKYTNEYNNMVTQVLLCGEMANDGTNYMSPVSGWGNGASYHFGATQDNFQIAGDGCDLEDNATEATADEVLYANNAFKVVGMFCELSGSGSNGVTLNLRSATANLTPDISITIPSGNTTGITTTQTTTNIAAGATFALRAITTEDLSAQSAWCLANIVIQE